MMKGRNATQVPPQAMNDSTGFLHLPNEIRNRIYELAIFDHDRGAVFLPRKLPRKVQGNGTKINECLMFSENLSHENQGFWPKIDYEDLDDECFWEDPERPPEEIPLPIYTEEETDDEAADRQRQSFDKWHLSFIDAREIALANEVSPFSADDLCLGCEEIDCICREPNHEVTDKVYDGNLDRAENVDALSYNEAGEVVGSMHADQDGSESSFEEQYESDGYIIPPDSCFQGHGENANIFYNCEFCGGFGLGEDQNEEAYVDSESDHENPLEEDDEHLDSEERIGMLFYTLEPGILLASKEIREQCLAIYYGTNAFSWRFFWQQPQRSLDRFVEWVEVVGDNAKYIRRVSFESRHAVEEGIEFEVDIDLLDQAPFFEVSADCIHARDELTDVTVEAIEQDFLAVLHRMSRRDAGLIKLSSGDIVLLGRVFCDAMRRDPGIAGDTGQWN